MEDDLSLLRSPQSVERRIDNEPSRSFFLSIKVILSFFLQVMVTKWTSLGDMVRRRATQVLSRFHRSDIVILLLSGECEAHVIVK